MLRHTQQLSEAHHLCFTCATLMNRLPDSRVLASQVTTRPELQLNPDISTFHPNRKPASPPQSDVKTIPTMPKQAWTNLNARFCSAALLRSLRHCPWHLLRPPLDLHSRRPAQRRQTLAQQPEAHTTSSPKARLKMHPFVLYLARCTPSLTLALRTRLGLAPRTPNCNRRK